MSEPQVETDTQFSIHPKTDPLAPLDLRGVVAGGAESPEIAFEVEARAGSRYHVAGNAGRIAPAGLELDVPSSLRDPANGADLIVITPRGWEGALAQLVAHRRAQGLRVVVANLTDVADEFAGGNVDDVAIRDFVRYAYENWQPPAVSYLLLVGEPSIDPLNQLEVANPVNRMPTHLTVTERLGETMSDTWFGAVAGHDQRMRSCVAVTVVAGTSLPSIFWIKASTALRPAV